MRRSLAVVSTTFVIIAALALAPLGAQAAPLYSLADGNSIASWDLTPGAQAGMYSWTIDGAEQAFQQWFWFRVGATGGETSYDTLPLTTSGVTDTNFNGEYDTLFAKYQTADFSTTFTFVLRGGALGSGASDIAESIKIQNLSGAPLDFHFYQYTDLDLAGTPDDDSVSFDSKVANNVVQQTDAAGNAASESVVTPPASHHEAGFYPSTLASLNDGLPTTLNDVGSAGPGNVSWAYQWDLLIPVGGTVLISKDKQIQLVVIPEPSSLVMLALAAGALAVPVARRRRWRPRA